jgi:phosphoglycerate dehydrogenase-like enzyme
MKLVIHPPVEQERLDRIRLAAGRMEVVNAADETMAQAAVADAEAFFGKITPAILQAAHRLRWVQTGTASLEHYMFPELIRHACTLTNMRGLYSDVIAETVFGYLLCFVRRLHVYLRQQQARLWRPLGGEHARSTFAAGPGTTSEMDLAHGRLGEATLGVVGLGGIGSAVARRGLAFGMKVIAVDPRADSGPDGIAWLKRPEALDLLLNESDHVVVCAPHTPRTVGLFDRLRFQQMRKSAFFVNVGRGAVVRLEDLCDALEHGDIAGAALDVYEIEPLPSHHRLWTYENVILTPHMAGNAPVIAGRHLATFLENLRRFQTGEPLQNVVDKGEWY